jgi:membrane-bound lytic murein transglycosylase D
MNKTGLILPAVALCLTACATTPAPKVTPSPAPSVTSAAAQIDAAEYRRALEDAYTQIVAREGLPVAAAPQVDLEAAASIPIPEHRTIRGAVNYFSTDLRDSIQTSLLRSGKYRKLIDAVFEDMKLPKGLAYLPVIESAYIPTLTSRAGAHGIWQFMPDTAREYGLRVDWWVDERADPERSTRAAATYLRDLYRQFNDWSLVLAAYNAGPGRVKRALEATGSTTFWELLEQSAVPKETRGYVPTFYATLLIASDPQTYGFTLGAADDVSAKRVDIDGPLSLKYLAQVANVPEETLRDLNPALRRGMLPPGRASVRVPAKVADTVMAQARTMKRDDAEIELCSFTLREGDSLKRLARALDTKPETILAMNGLQNASSIGRGDSLYLPVRARELGSRLRESENRNFYYAVRKGDTLYSVAKRHNLSVEELADLNAITAKTRLHPGQKLRVSSPRTVTAGGGM